LSGLFLSSCNDGTSPNNNNTPIHISLKQYIPVRSALAIKTAGSKSTSLGADDYAKSEDVTVNLSLIFSAIPFEIRLAEEAAVSWKKSGVRRLVNGRNFADNLRL